MQTPRSGVYPRLEIFLGATSAQIDKQGYGETPKCSIMAFLGYGEGARKRKRVSFFSNWDPKTGATFPYLTTAFSTFQFMQKDKAAIWRKNLGLIGYRILR